MGRLGCAALVGLLAGLPLAAQTIEQKQEPDVSFRVDVRLVRLLATVKDRNGALIGGLNQEDFVVLDSEVPQEIAVFERRTEQPLSIAMLIDTSGSTAREQRYEIESAGRFLNALVAEGNPNDALALYSFNHEVTLQTGYTRDSRRVLRALRSLKSEAGTSMYDAICLSAERLRNREGRKVVVIVTDGGDTTSYRTFHDAMRELHTADTVLYAILVVPIASDAGRNIGGENALTTLSTSTGGRMFAPSIGPGLDAAFAEILRDLRTQYLIGYYPRNLPDQRGDFRRVKIEVTRPDLQVFSRNGYYEK
jgi:Ca-activated chloride channel family protein